MAAPPESGGPLAGRTVFVAGATGTVGTAVSRMLVRHGANLIAHSHHPAGEPFGAGVRYVHGDITEPDQVGRLADGIDGPLDGIVNCVTGFDGRPQPLAGLSAKEFRRVVDVDLVGSFVLVTELLPRLASGARIVLFSSVVATLGRPAAAHLCAAKGGVRGLANGLARDLAPRDIRVRVVAPGPVGPHPGLPSCTPEQVADVVLFLSSGMSDGVPSGDVITVLGTKES